MNPTFEDFWNAYDKKVGKPKSEKKWNKLSLKNKLLIMEYIPKYKLAQPNKKYRKNPETFFNNESWFDEIIDYNDVKKIEVNGPITVTQMLKQKHGLA